MKFYQTVGEKISESVSLWDALQLSPDRQKVVSLVGAGGKTSLMYRLAEEAAEAGRRVIVTTSTHILSPQNYQVLVLDQGREEEVGHVHWTGNILVVGMRSGEGKLKGLPEESIGRLGNYADLLLIEADGAKTLPLKIPGDHEPVLIPETDAVIACAGLGCIGYPFEQVCFRFELAEQLCSVEPGTLVKVDHVADLLCSGHGGRKAVRGRLFRTVLNQADMARQEDIFQLAALIEARGERCVVTQLKR